MTNSIPESTLEKFATFGDLLRFLRRRVSITQVELATAVGYSDAQISRLEQNLRLPDIPTIEARFISALALENEPKAVARLLDLAANVRREDAPTFGVSPYKGLNYFDEADADLFAGREALTGSLTDRVLALSSSASSGDRRFLAIVGASGSGKSSLLRAGLVSALRWNKTSVDWRIHVFTPTAQPLESLAASLTDSVAATATLMDDLARDPRSLQVFIKRSAQPGNAYRVLLVVDQFEELFALCRSETARTSFIQNLLTASSEAGGPTTVVIALRADFYAHCAGYVGLRKAVAQEQEYIGVMNDDELRQAIEEPARRGRWEFEPGLVDLLLHDVGHEPGALPLLSHALLETWQRRRGHTLTLSGYTSSGGVRGAIAETAEAVFTDQFTPQQQLIARRIFLRLTELGDETATGDTRRRATISEMVLTPEDAAPTQAVLKALADARLITTSEGYVEVAHEALIREWPTLRGWLEDNRESLRFHRHLTEASQEWSALQHEPDMLYRGARLTQVSEWAAAHSEEMNELEREFVNASQVAAEREIAEREAQRERELQAARKLAEEQTRSANRLRGRNRLLRAFGAGGLVLALLAGAFGLQSSRNAVLAQASLKRAESLRLVAEANAIVAGNGDAETATLLAIRGLEIAYSVQADDGLSNALAHLYDRQRFRGHAGSIYSVAFSADGRAVLTASQDGTARLWDALTGRELQRFVGHKGGLSSAALSPDGLTVLTGGNDGTVRLWRASSGEQLRVLEGQTGGIAAVAFSPDGKYALAAAADGTARLWDLNASGGSRVFSGHTALVSSVAFSANGQSFLTGSFDDTVRLWDTSTGDVLRTFRAPDSGFFQRHVTSVALSPDGAHAVSASNDHTAAIWDLNTGQMLCTMKGHGASISAIAISRDGAYVLTASEDKTARIWRASDCQEVWRYLNQESGLQAVAFSPDGRYVLAGGQDGLARLWATPASAPPRTYIHQVQEVGELPFLPSNQYSLAPGGVTSAALSPDGQFVLTGGTDHIAKLWSTATGGMVQAFIGHSKTITGVAFSPDGRYVLTGSDDHTARLWDASTGRQLRVIEASPSGVAGVAFSPDGKHFLTTGIGGYSTGTDSSAEPTKLWVTSTGEEIRGFGQGPGMAKDDVSTAVSFSPDGKSALVLSGLLSRVADAEVFDLQTGKTFCVLTGHIGFATSVALSPDGRYALTGGEDYTARLWDSRSCRPVRLFTDNASAVMAVAFSPDAKYVLTGHDDGKARLWDAASGVMLREFPGHLTWVRSVAFSRDGKYVLTGSGDGTARLWDTDYHDTIKFACSLIWRDLTRAERQQYSIVDSGSTCPQP